MHRMCMMVILRYMDNTSGAAGEYICCLCSCMSRCFQRAHVTTRVLNRSLTCCIVVCSVRVQLSAGMKIVHHTDPLARLPCHS